MVSETIVFYYKCAIIISKNACIIINECNVQGFKKRQWSSEMSQRDIYIITEFKKRE